MFTQFTKGLDWLVGRSAAAKAPESAQAHNPTTVVNVNVAADGSSISTQPARTRKQQGTAAAAPAAEDLPAFVQGDQPLINRIDKALDLVLKQEASRLPNVVTNSVKIATNLETIRQARRTCFARGLKDNITNLAAVTGMHRNTVSYLVAIQRASIGNLNKFEQLLHAYLATATSRAEKLYTMQLVIRLSESRVRALSGDNIPPDQLCELLALKDANELLQAYVSAGNKLREYYGSAIIDPEPEQAPE